VLVVGGVVGDLGGVGVVFGVAVGPHVGDAEVVVAHLVAGGGVYPLAEDLELVVRQQAGVVFAGPDDEVLVVGGVVGHRRVNGSVTGVAFGSHVGQADLVADVSPGGCV